MANSTFIEGLFYRIGRPVRFMVINSAVILLLTAALIASSYIMNSPIAMSGGFILMAYSFYSMGKEGGVSYGLFFIFINLIYLLSSGQYFPPLVLIIFTLAFMAQYSSLVDTISETERRQVLWEERLEVESNDYRDKLERLKKVIEANKSRIKNYRVLNQVAQKLTSTLERKEIVKVISSAISEMIGKKDVKFRLLIYDESTAMFHPATDDKPDSSIIRGSVKIYRKDPLDEWIIKHKYNLIIKSIEDDLRFKTLRKDWINFKSMVAIPLIENKQIIGILKFYSNVPYHFDNEDVRILNYLGDLCTAAVQNSILYLKTKELAIRDGLTGLYMRRYFLERLDDELKRAKETKDSFSFLMVDIDHFKECNDTHGHQAGDRVLRMLGKFLKDNLRDVDIIGRYGGEEFGIILPSTKINGSRFVAERLREDFSKHVIQITGTEGIKLTLSAGGIEFKQGMKLMEIVNKADKALYYSKENGRNMVTFWEDIS